MAERQPYPSDLSDEAWELIWPVITFWKGQHRSVSGHAGRYDMREIVNAILYQARVGCQWRYLPHDFPPYTAVYYYFGKWPDRRRSSPATQGTVINERTISSRSRTRHPSCCRPPYPMP
ncbi:transposase [Streptomyces phaeochromogenes]